MRILGLMTGWLVGTIAAAMSTDDWLDQVDDALTTSAFHDQLRARLSGTLDLESYSFQQPAPGLLFAENSRSINPRLTFFLDSQIGKQIYVFAQSRVDRGFDPGADHVAGRFDEYALRFTPWEDGRFSLQIGKFATVVGNWVPRHHSWDNPFITAPLPYENLTGIFDIAAAPSADVLLKWAHVQPEVYSGNQSADNYSRVPIIWGPSYTSGAAISGIFDHFDYAIEFKNASLSSRPETWDAAQTQWQHPTFSGRLGIRPNAMWRLGFSASTGSYLDPSAQPTLAKGYQLDDYRETVLGQDISFAWHHLQCWAEFFETRFQIPVVGTVETFAYYLEAKYKFTPQLFGALRWNQQTFGTVNDRDEGPVRWGRDLWRIDVGPTYRFTPHVQLKLQYSLQHDRVGPANYVHLLAVQFTTRF